MKRDRETEPRKRKADQIGGGGNYGDGSHGDDSNKRSKVGRLSSLFSGVEKIEHEPRKAENRKREKVEPSNAASKDGSFLGIGISDMLVDSLRCSRGIMNLQRIERLKWTNGDQRYRGMHRSGTL